MAKPQNLRKLVLSIVNMLTAMTACSLIVAGSFVPQWARPLNVSSTDANTTYSLWGKEVCYIPICRTFYLEKHIETRTWWYDDYGHNHTTYAESVNIEPITTCDLTNYCNITWFEDINTDRSLLFVTRNLIISSFCCGLICIMLYIIKIIMLVLWPSWQRVYIRVAYLTFSTLAGVSAGTAVVLFVTKLENDIYELLWAPTLPGVGGFLFICISIDGCLRLRIHSRREEYYDGPQFSGQDSGVLEFVASGMHQQKKYKPDIYQLSEQSKI